MNRWMLLLVLLLTLSPAWNGATACANNTPDDPVALAQELQRKEQQLLDERLALLQRLQNARQSHRQSQEKHRELQRELQQLEQTNRQLEAQNNLLSDEKRIIQSLLTEATTPFVPGQGVLPDGRVISGKRFQVGPLLFLVSNDESIAGQLFPRKDDAVGTLPLKLVVAATPEQHEQLVQLARGAKDVPALLADLTPEGAGYLNQPQPPAPSTAAALYHHFASGGMVMIPIALAAWIVLAVMLMKLYCRRQSSIPLNVAAIHAAGKNLPAADAPTREAALRNLEAQAQEILRRAGKGQGRLAAVAGAAPLLGLLGTVTGMIRTFSVVAENPAAQAAELAAGISQALVTTEAGLLVAIPALLLHAWVARHNRRLAAALEEAVRQYE